MNALKNIAEQIQLVWRGASIPARVIFTASAVLCVALIVGVGIWSSRPQYVPLATNLDPNQAAEIVSKLDAQGIDNKLDFAGSTVSVAHADLAKARLAAGEHLPGGAALYESDDASFMDDPIKSRDRLLRRLEQSLARSIMSWRSVASATVHIAKAESTPFLREQTPTTASVLIDVRPSATFTSEQAAAVVAMVAGSVEDLTAENVTVTDTQGRVLYAPGIEAHTGIDSQLDFQRKIETELAAKAEHILARLLGEGHAMVRVTADIDFTKIEREERIVDPDNQAIVQETIMTESSTDNDRGAQGIPGYQGNTSPQAGSGSSSAVDHERKESTTITDPGTLLEKTTVASGQIKRLTIAAVVDLSAGEAEPQDGETAATGVTKEQVERIIQQAVGFDPLRNDKVEVLVSKLAGANMVLDEQLTAVDHWDFYIKLAQQASLGLASIVALVLGLLIIRRMRFTGVPASQNDWFMAGRARALAELSQQAKQNPDAVSKIIASWLNEPIDDSAPDDHVRTASRPTQPERRAA